MNLYMRYIVIFISLLLTANVTAATHNGKNIDNKEYKCDVKQIDNEREYLNLKNQTCTFKDDKLILQGTGPNGYYSKTFLLPYLPHNEVKNSLRFELSDGAGGYFTLVITFHFDDTIQPNNFNYNF